MVIPEGMYGGTDTSVNDDFEERKGGAYSVCMESEGRGGCEEAVHDIVRVWREANEKEELWALLDGAYDALDGGVGLEPAFDRIAEERARDDKYNERTQKRCKIRDDSARPWAKSVSR